MLLTILRITAMITLFVTFGCTPSSTTPDRSTHSGWKLVDDFEQSGTLDGWINIDAQNDTKPFVANPQVSVIRTEQTSGNNYLLRKPAADGVVGNRKALGFKPLPKPIEAGETATLYTRINVEYFPNNHSFGLSNAASADIGKLAYDAFEPMIRITDKAESNGLQNSGTITVLNGYKSYARIINPISGNAANPLVPGVWYEVWVVVNNATAENGGQRYDVYMRGGEFADQQRVFKDAVFRMQRGQPLTSFIAISNTGPKRAPYGNGGVRYDDIYMARGQTLTAPSVQ